MGALQERGRTGEDPRRDHAVKNHAAERGTRHERPDGIASKVMRKVPARMNQPVPTEKSILVGAVDVAAADGYASGR